MRVISGSARGRKLREPAGQAIRPTTDQVKESIFNIIQFEVVGRRVLDLYAGTGQLGIEALSRGASAVVFVDETLDAVKLVRDNLKAAGIVDKAEVLRGEALTFLKSCGKFDLIFLDPPYDTGLLEKSIARIIEFDILSEHGIIICESKADKVLPDVAHPYYKGREYRYGRIKITLYNKNMEADPQADN